ncbi:MAG: HEAT repeat domain-containing protein [Myxococcota bacterium]
MTKTHSSSSCGGRLLARAAVSFTLVLSVAPGCGGSAAYQAASSGDLRALRTELDQRAQARDVDLGEAQRIAHRMLSRQIAGARGDSGERTLSALPDACVLRVEDALAARADRDDELAALALMRRIDAGLEPNRAYAAFVGRSEPHWRAVGARSLNRPYDPRVEGRAAENQAKEARWRRDLLVDPSPGVRRGALLAAAEARHPGDTDAVLESARLDPSAENRRLAVDALGAIGTHEAVMGLKDRWDASDEAMRLRIIEAWARVARNGSAGADDEDEVTIPCRTPPQRATCVARYHVRRMSEGGSGMANLVASLATVVDVDPDDATTEQGNAAAVIERVIDEASTRVRVHAVEEAPVAWPRLLVAIEEAKDDPNPRVAVAANARLLALGGDDRAPAIERLRKLAEQSVSAPDARRALAAGGDATTAGTLDQDVAAASFETRSRAGELLAQMGQVHRALPLLADPDAEVRSRVACAFLDLER